MAPPKDSTVPVQMPVASTWRTSTAEPQFTVGERNASRDAPCQGAGSNDGGVAILWPGAAFSVTDQQAQADLVPRSLLAGAALGVAAQLLIEFAMVSVDPFVRSG
jgi:hypothetical protein